MFFVALACYLPSIAPLKIFLAAVMKIFCVLALYNTMNYVLAHYIIAHAASEDSNSNQKVETN